MKKANLLCVFLVYAICTTMLAGAPAFAVTLTFDDIPQGQIHLQYWYNYGVAFDAGFSAVDHTGSDGARRVPAAMCWCGPCLHHIQRG